MSDLPSTDEWIEVFRAGTHTAMNGTTRTWTEADLDHAVAAYDPVQHEAPLVVGHPKDNDPAYGWVEAAKREGDRLLVKPKQVDPAFREMVKAGRFKKRSISFYADGTIRHIGFLGAQPPAVKGLKDCHFAQGDEGVTYEEATGGKLRQALEVIRELLQTFAEGDPAPAATVDEAPIQAIMDRSEAMCTLERIKWISSDEIYRIVNDEDMAPDEKKAQLRALFDELKGLIDQNAGLLISSFAERSEEMADPKVGAIQMTPEELKAHTQDAVKAALAQFAEGQKAVEQKVETTLAALQAKARQEQITAFCERLQEKGVAPALVKDTGLAAILEQCDAVQEFSFAEGKEKQTLAQAVQAVILAFAEAAGKGTLLVDFSERGKGRSQVQQDAKARALVEYAEHREEYEAMGVSPEDLERAALALGR